jgi:hypothetical protein
VEAVESFKEFLISGYPLTHLSFQGKEEGLFKKHALSLAEGGL